MRLTPALRTRLKKPLGGLVKDASEVPEAEVLVAVGDTASDSLIRAGKRPTLVVYDASTQRRRIGVSEAIAAYDAKPVTVANPAGELRREVFEVFREALRGGRTKVFVEGEEDLTTLAAVREAPLGAVVVYGQPDVGLVVVRIDGKIKGEVESMLEEMEDGR